MRALIACVALMAQVAYGGLEKIDADGVTKTGGSPSYANMIPLTGSDGKLSYSFLPPVSNWASVPVSNLYYVSSYADDGGNGSFQYPFKSLTKAVASAGSDSVIILAPGSYSGKIRMSPGQHLTVFGYGTASKATRVDLHISGTDETTTLDLVNFSVNRLHSYGGALQIRLTGSYVGTLSGDLSRMKVVRTDMGSQVYTSDSSYADTYSGYPTVSNAMVLISHDGTTSMTLGDARATVGDETVAYVSDLPGLTNVIHVKLAELSAVDAAIVGLVNAEATIRTNADLSVIAYATSISNSLSSQLTSVGTGWNTQFSSLNTVVGATSESLSSLWVKETNDVDRLEKSISSVYTAYAAADSSLETTLRSYFSSELATINGNIATVAGTTADARIAAARASIIADASAGASSSLTPRVTAVENRTTALETRAGRIEAGMKAQSNSLVSVNSAYAGLVTEINSLKAADTANLATIRGEIDDVQYLAADALLETRLNGRMVALSNSVNAAIASVTGSGTSLGSRVTTLETTVSDYGSIKSDVSSLKSWKTEMTTWKTGANSTDRAIKDKINDILTWLYSISNKVEATGVLPAKFP